MSSASLRNVSQKDISKLEVLNQQRLTVPRSVANVILLVLAVLLLRCFFQVHFGVQISPWEAIGLPVAVALVGLLFNYLPADAKTWTSTQITVLLSSKSTTKVAIAFLVIMIVLATSVSTVAVSWTGPPAVEILKNGLRIAPVADDSRSTITLFTLSFLQTTITVKSYSITVRPVPLKQSHVVIPFYVTASDVPELGMIENLLDLALLQQTPARYIKEAVSRLSHLKDSNKGISAAELERLEDISNVLQQALVDAQQSDIKSHLVDAYAVKRRPKSRITEFCTCTRLRVFRNLTTCRSHNSTGWQTEVT